MERCNGCGACVEVCPTGALYLIDGKASVDKTLCRESKACIAACPTEAITIVVEKPEIVAEPERQPALQPEPDVIQVRTQPAPVPLRVRVLPAVGAALSWAGREIVPRLANYLLDSLDRRATGQTTTTTARDNESSCRGGRRRRRRRRGRSE